MFLVCCCFVFVVGFVVVVVVCCLFVCCCRVLCVCVCVCFGGSFAYCLFKDLAFLVDFVVIGTMYLKVLVSYIMITGSYKLHCHTMSVENLTCLLSV